MPEKKQLEFVEPTISESINRLRFFWPDMELLVEADRITDAGVAELWFYHANSSGNHLLHVAKANLLSSSTMTQLGKRMLSHSTNTPWAQVLTCISSQTIDYQRRGEPGVNLKPTDPSAHKPVFFIEPMIIKGVPNVIFGEKGVNKTTLSLAMLGHIEIGWDQSLDGILPLLTAKTAILDWESSKELTEFTLARLTESGTIAYCEPAYLRCKAPLADDIQRIANFLGESRPEVVLIDSLGQAAGSDKFDSSGKASALKFFEALRQLNVTSLIIAQTSKSETGIKTIFGSTYFTYYARNIFELRKSKDSISESDLHLALIHTDSNYTKRSQPLGFHVSFTDTSILIEREEVTLAQLKDRIEDTQAITEFLRLERKLCSVKSVSDAIEKSENRTRVVLSLLKKRGKVVNPATGLWGLALE